MLAVRVVGEVGGSEAVVEPRGSLQSGSGGTVYRRRPGLSRTSGAEPGISSQRHFWSPTCTGRVALGDIVRIGVGPCHSAQEDLWQTVSIVIL